MLLEGDNKFLNAALDTLLLLIFFAVAGNQGQILYVIV
jgi:hypothetical protein